jgi:hypothetical protein
VLVQPGATLRVADLGRVFSGAPDRTQLFTGNGRDAVSISIAQQLLSLRRPPGRRTEGRKEPAVSSVRWR